MAELPRPPQAFEDFVKTYPKLDEAWAAMTEAGAAGPLDERTARLIKLAVAIGAQRQGAVRASARKGYAIGLAPPEMEQVVALAASTIGLPAAVAAFSWIRDVIPND